MKQLIRKFIPSPLLDCYHFILALFGAIFYCFPSRKIKVIGVTGTNGKTTTVSMAADILEKTGHKTAALSSVYFKIGDKQWQNNLRMTMPGRFKIQKFLRQAVNVGCKYAVMEVSSEGVKQFRHKFINFNTAVFTNLSPEHIEAHGGFENYKKAKGELFAITKGVHIINSDDKNADYFLQIFAREKYLYQVSGKNFCKIAIRNSKGDLKSVEDFVINLKIPGEFNVSNALAAICIGLSEGIGLNVSKKAVEEFLGIPGRMEEVISSPFRVFIDYAFTPNALEKVYKTLKNSGRLICVLGACGGGRDKWKRPVLGEIAGKYGDEIIITNEDPYDEKPEKIIEEVASGSKKPVKRIIDRREAIREALKSAKAGDTVIITGKGCEPSINMAKGRKTLWNEKEVVKEEFLSLNKN